MYPPGYTPATSVNPPCALDLDYFHPHHLDLPPGDSYYFPLPNAPLAQDFSKLGFVYITVLGLANQLTPLVTEVIYLVIIAPIVHMTFQAWPASPVGVHPNSGIDCDIYPHVRNIEEPST
ncbi:hypothetical protein DSO57_1029934 [Entomophthora muscae]|uniref:Uncharacterized protein n=1 Tax=Entomophthora muscae TaxID=34485 RepID=A0ACC2SDU0_9FUNG|nr:hypothetical protein DSO57_1029934 [Entomophthora muscae]